MTELPDRDTCLKLLEEMILIRSFEERTGEMYMRAKIGGFLHLAIGEEASVVGVTSAMEDRDYLLTTYRDHGYALARGMSANTLMAELYGKVDGCSKGRGGSMHLFDLENRFLGGYGIVGANLPIAAGVGLASSYRESDEVTVCTFGDGAINQGTFGETMNLAALWKLPVVFVCINNQYGMGTALSRHSAVTDLSKKAECFGVAGRQVDGMDVIAVKESLSEQIEIARTESRPTLVEVLTYRYRGHSAADPEIYRTKDEVEQWRKRDPITAFSEKSKKAELLSDSDLKTIESRVSKVVEEAIRFAEQSPEPPLESLYDDIYSLGDQVQGWYSLDARAPGAHRGEQEREIGREGAAKELAESGAAYARVEDRETRESRELRRREDERP